MSEKYYVFTRTPGASEQYNVDDLKSLVLGPVRKINIFIGPNNSGKSRFLRMMFKNIYDGVKVTKWTKPKGAPAAKYDFGPLSTKSYSKLDLISACESFYERMESKFKDFPIIINRLQESKKSALQEIGQHSSDRIHSLLISNVLSTIYHSTDERTMSTLAMEETKSQSLPLGAATKLKKEAVAFSQVEYENIANKMRVELEEFKDLEATYIPTLRTLKDIGAYKINESNISHFEGHKTVAFSPDINSPVLKFKTVHDYFPESHGSIKVDDGIITAIFTGESMHEELRIIQGSSSKTRQRKKQFEKFLGENFFEGETFEMHANEEHQAVYVQIGDKPEDEFPIAHLGDGIQSIIILCFKIFLNQHRSHHLFIEEPEMYLHPGFQRVFLKLCSQIKGLRVFVTSHSNHLVDLSTEFSESVSVFNFSKRKSDGTFLIEPFLGNERRLLESLGVKPSSVLLSNCTIWVEGITDRWYIRKYLELYQEDQKANNSTYPMLLEDIHFSFVEYGGSNVTHYTFTESEGKETTGFSGIDVSGITKDILVIMDEDDTIINPTGAKAILHEQIINNIGEEHVHRLPVREIENLLSPAVLFNIVDTYEKAKRNSSFTINQFTQADYRSEYLGTFLDQNIENKKVSSYAAPQGSGTIRDKVRFARTAIQHMSTYNNLTPDAKELVEKIVEFVRQQN